MHWQVPLQYALSLSNKCTRNSWCTPCAVKCTLILLQQTCPCFSCTRTRTSRHEGHTHSPSLPLSHSVCACGHAGYTLSALGWWMVLLVATAHATADSLCTALLSCTHMSFCTPFSSSAWLGHPWCTTAPSSCRHTVCMPAT